MINKYTLQTSMMTGKVFVAGPVHAPAARFRMRVRGMIVWMARQRVA